MKYVINVIKREARGFYFQSELLADTRLDISEIKHRIERADKQFPGNLVVFQLEKCRKAKR